VLDTFEALGVFLLGGLPGAMYVWGWERQVGQWGISAADRILRFIAGSAVFQALFIPATYLLWRDYVRSGILKAGLIPHWWWLLWLGGLAYVLAPFVAGVWVGGLIYAESGAKRRMSQVLNGLDPAPRAWDHVFSSGRNTWIRLRLQDGTWLGGLYVRLAKDRSYAAGFPYDQDLYLCKTAPVDENGAFLEDPLSNLGPGILVRWAEVQYLTMEDA
jgi:hypothetical protein